MEPANGLAQPAALVPLLCDSGADVIILQELAKSQAAALHRHLRDIYPHQFLLSLGMSGKALSRNWPLAHVAPLPLYPNRPAVQATIASPDAAITFVVAHPPPPRFRRNGPSVDPATAAQVDDLIAATTVRGPTILMGDFNVVGWNETYRRLAHAGLGDAFKLTGRGGGDTLRHGWPSGRTAAIRSAAFRCRRWCGSTTSG